MSPNLKNLLIEPLAAFAFPPVCQICDANRAEPADGFVCADCLKNVHPTTRPFCPRCGQQLELESASASDCHHCHGSDWAFDSARSLFTARGLIREIVHRFKYNDAEHFLPLLENWMQTADRFIERSPGWIVPVPLHPVKERERGFNQAQRMAEMVSRVIGVPMDTKLVRRVKFTETQTHLSRKKRIANMRNAFSVSKKRKISGTILLVDDVMTTGATAGACAAVLQGAGAERVEVLTLARGVPF